MSLQVRDLERRQEKEHAREEAKAAKQLQREASERERQTQVMAQEAAAQLQLQVRFSCCHAACSILSSVDPC